MRVRINTTSTGARIGSGINARALRHLVRPVKKDREEKDARARTHRGEDPESSLLLSPPPLPSRRFHRQQAPYARVRTHPRHSKGVEPRVARL